jgi:putative salt-induced outer membrane protein
MRKFAAILLLVVSVALQAEAPENTPAAPLWENSAEASVLLTSGNTDVTTIGLGAASTYRPAPWAIKGKAALLTSSNAGIKTAESYEAALRGERNLTNVVSLYLAGSYLKNEFTGFQDRLGGDVGVNFVLLGQGEHSLSSEASLGLLKENLVSGVGGASLGSRSFVNGRLGVEYKWKFSPTADFSNALAFLENFANTSDWRLSNTAAVTAILTDIFSLKVGFRVDYLNQPVTGKKSTDTTTTAALVAKF